MPMPVSRRWLVLGLTLAAMTFSGGCGPSSPALVVQASETPSDAVPHLRDADDAARFIAGMPGTEGSPFAALEATEAWMEHRRRLDRAWHEAEPRLIGELQEFQKEELN